MADDGATNRSRYDELTDFGLGQQDLEVGDLEVGDSDRLDEPGAAKIRD